MNYDLGKFVMIPRGDYDSSVTYSKLDLVYYDNKTWISKVDNNTNIIPSTTNSYYWGIVCEGMQGATGAQGTAGQDGTQGYDGAQGSIGMQGSIGSQGVQGAKGRNGDSGTYIWYTEEVLNDDEVIYNSILTGGGDKVRKFDFIIDVNGTLFQIVDLIGDTQCRVKYVMKLKGSDGNAGAQGTQGYRGTQGAIGAQGLDGAYAAQGVQGAQGTAGTQGAIGAQGTAPANTETFTFEMLNGTTVTKTFYIIP